MQYHYGWGRHFAYLSAHQRTQAIKFNYITQGFGQSIASFPVQVLNERLTGIPQ